MHTRRIATFLLGVWIGCSLLMDFLSLQNPHAASLVIANATAPAGKRLRMLSEEDATLLMRYQAAEMNRHYAYDWELMQIALALALGACAFLGTQKRIVPLALCGAMLAIVALQHIAITPELAYRGRDADFPPGSNTFATLSRLWTMQQISGVTEGLKLVLGGILASYLFVFRSGRRKKVRVDETADRSHVEQA